MKNRPLIGMALFAAAGAAWLCWHFFNQDPDANEAAAVARPAAPAKGSLLNPMAKSAEPWPEFGTPEFKKLALERGRKWLESRDRDASSLVAMWDVTGEEALLLEAAEKFPNEPRVCMAMICRPGAKDRLKWIEKLIAAEPNNPEGQYLKAWVLSTAKDQAGALAALRMAVTTDGERDNHLRDRIMTVREAALASGAGIKDAAQLALMAGLTNGGTNYAGHGALKIIRQEMAAAKASGDQTQVLDIAGVALASVRQMQSPLTLSLVDGMVSVTLEKYVLGELPDEMEIGTSGRNVAQQRQELDAQREELSRHLKQDAAFHLDMSLASDTQVAEFTDRFLLHGERAARTWLLEQFPPAK